MSALNSCAVEQVKRHLGKICTPLVAEKFCQQYRDDDVVEDDTKQLLRFIQHHMKKDIFQMLQDVFDAYKRLCTRSETLPDLYLNQVIECYTSRNTLLDHYYFKLKVFILYLFPRKTIPAQYRISELLSQHVLVNETRKRYYNYLRVCFIENSRPQYDVM